MRFLTILKELEVHTYGLASWGNDFLQRQGLVSTPSRTRENWILHVKKEGGVTLAHVQRYRLGSAIWAEIEQKSNSSSHGMLVD